MLHCFGLRLKKLAYLEPYYILMMQDVYFNDESAEVVISSLRLGDDQER